MSSKDPFLHIVCRCSEDHYPEWFTQYMKKFKKDLLKDLRSNISEIIHEEFEKEKKLAEAKSHKPLPDKNESSTIKLLRKKKISDKDIDLFEKREMKLLKKFDKLCKIDGVVHSGLHLEKLEKKGSPHVDKRQLLERGHKNKTRDSKKTLEVEKKYKKSGKFTLVSESWVFLLLQPGAEFSFTINISNNGKVPWISPCIECCSTPDIYIREQLINLPKLEPGQSVNVTIRGKATQNLGHYCFTYKLFDGLERFGPSFSCFAVVSESEKEIIPNFDQLKLNHNITPSENFVGTLINTENVTIASSQKKIKENITEIKRTLQDIDLLGQCTSTDKNRKERLNDNPEEFEVRLCDSVEDKDKKFLKERIEKEIISTINSFEEMGKIEKSGIVGNENFQTQKNGDESDSDSELSVILTSEEDENFIFVSLLPESSNSETLNNMAKPSKLDLNKESKKINQKLKEDIVEECSEKVQPKEIGSGGVSSGENCPCCLSGTGHHKFAEVKPSFESRRNTSQRFGGTYFPTCYRKVYAESPDYSAERPLSRNMKTGEKRSYDQIASNNVFCRNHECTFPKDTEMLNIDIKGHMPDFHDHESTFLKDMEMPNIDIKGRRPEFLPKYDCLGRPIYAVRNDGCCFPMIDLVEMVNSEETQKKLKAETNVNNTATVGGTKTTPQIKMISAASKAFEAAKCVINNLQSAFKQEMENEVCDTEKHKPNEESVNNFPHDPNSMGKEERHYVEKLTNKEKYLYAILTLHEMGFVNRDLNFRLLKKHDCNLFDVITEILDKPAGESVGANTI